MSLNNRAISGAGGGGDTSEIVEAGDVLSFESPDGTYYLDSDRTVEGTVYPAGTTLIKDGNQFVEVSGSTGPGINPSNPNFQRLLTASRHTPLKVVNLEAYRIFTTQQDFVTYHTTRATNGLAAGVFGTPFDVTSSAPQPLTLRPIVMEFSPAGQTEIIGENNPAGNGFEILSDQDGVRYKFFNGIWINAAINKWYILGVAGQSNSVGYGEQLGDENYDSRDPRIYQLGRFNGYFNKIIPATHCIHHIDNTTTENDSSLPAGVNADSDIRAGVIGPSKYLADKLIRNLPDNTGILIVGGGNGGTGFSSALQGNTFNAYPSGYNLINAQLSNGQNIAGGEVPYGAQEDCRRWGTNQPMFNDFIYRLKLALQLDNSFMLGIYWAQGESDVDADNINLTTSVGGLIDEFNTQMATNNTQMPNGDVRNLGWYIPSFTKWGLVTENRRNKMEQLKQLAEQRDNVYYTDVTDARTNEEDPNGNRVGGGPDIHFSNRGYRETVIPRVEKLIEANPFSKGVFLQNEIEEDLIPNLDTGLVMNLKFEDVNNVLHNSAELSAVHKVDISNLVGTPNRSISLGDRKGNVVNLDASNIIGVDAAGFTGSFTYSCSFRSSDLTNANNIFTTRNSSGTVFWLPSNNRLQVQISFPTATNTYDLPSGTFENQWFHVVFRYTRLSGSNGRSDLFLNGELVNTATTSDTPNISQMQIGRYFNVANTEFIGQMDDIRLYNRSISNKEVTQIYDADGKQEQVKFVEAVNEVITKFAELVPDLDDGKVLDANFRIRGTSNTANNIPTGYTATISGGLTNGHFNNDQVLHSEDSSNNVGRYGSVLSVRDGSRRIRYDTTGFNSSFTYACSFRSTDLTNPNNIFTSRNDNSFVLWLSENNRIDTHIRFSNLVNRYVLPSGTFLNEWYHVIFRWNDINPTLGRADLFLNGTLVSSNTTSDRPDISSMASAYGTGAAAPFIGHITDIKLYNKALTDHEAKCLYILDGQQKLLPIQKMLQNAFYVNGRNLHPYSSGPGNIDHYTSSGIDGDVVITRNQHIGGSGSSTDGPSRREFQTFRSNGIRLFHAIAYNSDFNNESPQGT